MDSKKKRTKIKKEKKGEIPYDDIEINECNIKREINEYSKGNKHQVVDEIGCTSEDIKNVNSKSSLKIEVQDMTNVETGHIEFMENEDNMMNDIESSDDELYINDLLPDYENNDAEVNYEELANSGAKNKRRKVDLSLSNDVVRNKVEENVFGDWYDVTESDSPPDILPFPLGIPNTGTHVPESSKEPIDYFKLFVTDEFINNIVSETNQYAAAKINSSNFPSKSSWQSWRPVDFREMSAFIGVVLNMGLIPLEKTQDYWTIEPNLQIPFFSNTFRRHRFLQIFWILRLYENVETKSQNKKIYMVDNFLKYIETQFQTYYVPNKNICVVESAIKSRGKVTFLTCNKNELTGRGIRIYALTDRSNGYVYSILPYYGSITAETLVRPELSIPSRIVLQLYSKLLHKMPEAIGYRIFCDQYFSSLSLANELLKLKCYFTSSVNKHRKLVPDFIKNPKFTDSKKTVACRANNMMLLAWKDKQIITMVSTCKTSEISERKLKNDGTIINIEKPKVVASYTKFLRGVDQANELTASYCFLGESFLDTSKWWRKLFFWGIEVCSINSYILYKTTMLGKNQTPMSRFKFVSTLVKQLVGDFKEGSLTHRTHPSVDAEERLNGKLHCIMKWQTGKKKDCMVCSKRNVENGRHETRFYCGTCTRNPGLHPGECFSRYHTMKIFKL